MCRFTRNLSNSIAPVYGSKTSYAVGDVCTHEGIRYVCTTAIPTLPEKFNVNCWQVQAVSEASGGGSSGKLDATSEAAAYDETKASGYAVGDFCTYDSKAWMCTTAIPAGGEPWTVGHWTQANLSTLFGSGNTSLMGVCRYSISPLAVTEGAATATDSAVNTVTLAANTTISAPASTGRVRDWIVYVTEDASTAYTVTFNGTFVKDFTSWPTIAAGEKYVFSFTEVATDTFLVAYKKVS